MNRYNVAILYGGKSGEHDISLMSASSVEKHLDKNRFNVHLIGITMSGKWFYQPDYKNTNDTLDIEEDEKNIISIIPGKGFTVNNTDLNIDFVFPILHGTYGEDGTVQGLLDLINIPYAGSGLDGSFMAMDKEFAKILWQNRGLPVVPFISFKKHQYITNPSMVISEISNKFDYPLFIKPVKAGSSVGVSRVSCQSELSEALEKAFTFDLKVLIEPAVNAREIECSVIGNNSPQTFSLGEIAPSHEFYDYEAKYLDPNGAKLIIPAQIDKAIIQEMKKLAITAYSTLNLKGFSRVDFFLEKESNKIMINEINTIPGFTNISMFAMLCANDGLDYSTLLDKIFEYGIEKYNEQNSLNLAAKVVINE